MPDGKNWRLQTFGTATVLPINTWQSWQQRGLIQPRFVNSAKQAPKFLDLLKLNNFRAHHTYDQQIWIQETYVCIIIRRLFFNLAGILFFHHVNFEKGMYFFAIRTHSSTLESKYKKERTYFYQVSIKFVILEQKSWVENVNLQIGKLLFQLAFMSTKFHNSACPHVVIWRSRPVAKAEAHETSSKS